MRIAATIAVALLVAGPAAADQTLPPGGGAPNTPEEGRPHRWPQTWVDRCELRLQALRVELHQPEATIDRPYYGIEINFFVDGTRLFARIDEAELGRYSEWSRGKPGFDRDTLVRLRVAHGLLGSYKVGVSADRIVESALRRAVDDCLALGRL